MGRRLCEAAGFLWKKFVSLRKGRAARFDSLRSIDVIEVTSGGEDFIVQSEIS